MPIHVHGGSVLLARLAEAGVPGERLEWSEVLCEGPVPVEADDEVFRHLRADWLAEHTGDPAAASRIAAGLRAQDEALAAAAARDELVLWTGNEWFCQAIALGLIARLAPTGARLSWVTADDHPDRPGCSVSELGEAALAQAFAARERVDPATIALAVHAWDAYRAPAPMRLQALVDDPAAFAAWPALRDALMLHLAEWPGRDDGLARTERQLLAALVDGPADVGALLRACGRAEARPWLTDLLVLARLRRLASGDDPLVRLHGAAPPELTAEITEAGLATLAGRARWGTPVRWLGGACLDAVTPWCWDGERGRVVQWT
ncbi:hypothetical protein [Nannocystis punicea]|uniref:DUF1835 domain-containing protein n=1 Tax=Nannocystis punicea TaxID=2995304 RepID=A0ABY7H0D4_9BACT|nr:hypothetical protein [Nannocystis poenicansa]WAS92484.1 hypothetical protein O0S08_40410 [Nannocystis poenicansa]